MNCWQHSPQVVFWCLHSSLSKPVSVRHLFVPAQNIIIDVLGTHSSYLKEQILNKGMVTVLGSKYWSPCV